MPAFTVRQIEKTAEIAEKKDGLILVCGREKKCRAAAVKALLLLIQQDAVCRRKTVRLKDFFRTGTYTVQTPVNGFVTDNHEKPKRYISRRHTQLIVTGEINDRRDAYTAVCASLSGCLVLAALRTDDAADAFMHMVDLGVDPPALTSVLNGIIVQKFVHTDKKAILLADVASVSRKLKDVAVSRYTKDELDDCFLHCTNVVSEILGLMRYMTPSVYQDRRIRSAERVCSGPGSGSGVMDFREEK
jgi:Tfp pilus assembly pilus retraction ATPase PilT